MHGSRSSYTRARILEVAGRLFADKGHDHTSLREVTAEANVNLSSVNYHFGSKEGLVQAVYERQLEILDRERLCLLDALELEAAGRPVEAWRIVDAFFRPLIRHANRHAAGKTPFMPILEMPLSECRTLFEIMVSEHHAATLARYHSALVKSLPDIPESELLWRFLFMLGAASSAISGIGGLLYTIKQHAAPSTDPEALSTRLTAFLSGGLIAPLAPDTLDTPAINLPPAAAAHDGSLSAPPT